MAARQWTDEQRARQAELINRWRPWSKSTGPRTQEGKSISSQNVVVGLRKRQKALEQAKAELAAAQAKILKLSGKKAKLTDWGRLEQFVQTLSF